MKCEGEKNAEVEHGKWVELKLAHQLVKGSQLWCQEALVSDWAWRDKDFGGPTLEGGGGPPKSDKSKLLSLHFRYFTAKWIL